MTKSKFYLHVTILIPLLIAVNFGLVLLAQKAWGLKDGVGGSTGIIIVIMFLLLQNQNKLLKNEISLKKWYLTGIMASMAGTMVGIILNLVWP